MMRKDEKGYALNQGGARQGAENSAPMPENMYYDRVGRLKIMPGYKKIRLPRGEIKSISCVGESLLVHSGNALYVTPLGSTDSKAKRLITLKGAYSRQFSFGKICFITTGDELWQIDADHRATMISDNPIWTMCRCAAIFDGRLFLSGNPMLPGLIFYSTPLRDSDISFNIDNVIAEGSGLADIVSLLSLDGCLWIFKSEDDGDGGIVCRSSDVGYPISRIISHQETCYGAGSIDGTPVFISDRGVMAIRSEGLTPMPCGEIYGHRDNDSLGVWQGNLALLRDKDIYLLDAKSRGCTRITPVCGYKNDRRVFKYAAEGRDGSLIHPDQDRVAAGEIYSYKRADGEVVYFSLEGKKRYAVYPAAERQGGEEIMPTSLLCVSDLMYLATDEGVYLFSEDCRTFAGHTYEYHS